MKKQPQLIYVQGASPYNIARERASYLLRAARSRKSIISHCGNGYLVDDTKMFILIVA